MAKWFACGLAVLSATGGTAAAQDVTAQRIDAGALTDGARVEAIELSNGRGVTARVLTYGATMQSLVVPDYSAAPLKLGTVAAPAGTRATIAGYPQDRAHKMTADRDCELGKGGGRMILHTCRGTHGYSGAPILVSGADDKFLIAGVHVGASRRNGAPTMLAVPVPAQAIRMLAK